VCVHCKQTQIASAGDDDGPDWVRRSRPDASGGVRLQKGPPKSTHGRAHLDAAPLPDSDRLALPVGMLHARRPWGRLKV
jgi:hypothetical protein